MDRNGFLVNGAGYYLQGWGILPTGQPDRTRIAPIRINELVFNPVPTGRIDLAANLPAGSPFAAPATLPTATTGGTGPQQSSVLQVIDALGTQRQIGLNWWRVDNDTWRLRIDAPGAAPLPGDRVAEIDFGGTIPGGPTAAPGTISGITSLQNIGAPGAGPFAVGDPAELTFEVDYGFGPQTVSLRLGGYGVPTGLTNYAGTEYSVRDLRQDGAPLGNLNGVAIQENGDVAVNYDNGRTRIVARVPVVAFNDPDRLQRLDGQAFQRTVESGEARVIDASSNGAGKLVTGAVERSNVDIAAEFSKLIVAQRAYTANTRIVSASDEMLQDTINMRR
jgi:flagellar hook protein FlgE